MPIDSSKFSSNSLTGTVKVSNGFANVSLPTAFYALEGDVTFNVQIRTDSVEGAVIFTSPTITLRDTSSFVSLTANTATVNEGDLVAFTLVTANAAGNSTLYYSVFPATANVTSADFVANTGSFYLTNNSGTFTLKANSDLSLVNETGENFRVQLRTVGTRGNVVYTSSNITIADTSNAINVLGLVESTASPVSAGASITFTFAATNIPVGTIFYYSTEGNVTSFSSNTGSFALNSTSNTFVITNPQVPISASRSFNVIVRSGSSSGTIVATSNTMVVVDNSIFVNLTTPTTFVNTGSNVVFNLNTTSLANNTLLYYYTVGNVISSNFVSGNTGSFRSTLNSTNITLQSNTNIPTGEERFLQLKIAADDGTSATPLITSNVFTIKAAASFSADYLVVAGGGGTVRTGGGNGAGGGGAGGLLTGTLSLTTGTTYTITVGGGGPAGNLGPGVGINGSNSIISGSGITTLTSIGGGGSYAPGGSGGGQSFGIPGQGFPGGTYQNGLGGAGGGGAGGAGTNIPPSGNNGQPGGPGVAWPLNGTTYAGGGGGGGSMWQPGLPGAGTPGPGGSGGSGGGGPGANPSPTGTISGTAGTINTGGGAGGSNGGPGFTPSPTTWLGAAGGSGIVALAIPTPQYSPSNPGGGAGVANPGSAPGKTVLIFTSSGTITFP